MNQYIITEEELHELLRLRDATNQVDRVSIASRIRSHPYNPQAERDENNEPIFCVCGLTTKQCEERSELLKQAEREKVLDTIIQWREKQPTNRCREMSDWCDIWFDEDAFLEKLREGKDGEQTMKKYWVATDYKSEGEIRQDEREKVLDELERWGCGYFGYDVNVPSLMEKIAELREGKDGE